MTIKVPQLWSPTAYIRFIRKETGGARALTHLAELVDPSGKTCLGYVKHFTDTSPRGLFNEWFGYAFMSSLGVPQPPAAFLHAPVMGDASTVAYAFVSLQSAPVFDGTPKAHYTAGGSNAALKDRVLACPTLPMLIAADQLVMNGDRNLGNLVFTGKNSFVAIDHSDILGGCNWALDALQKPTKWAHSKLIESTGWVQINDLTPSQRSAIFAAAEVATEKFYELQIQLNIALNDAQSQDVKTALDAVWWRSLELADWFKDKLHLQI